jgi:hypothetical protein
MHGHSYSIISNRNRSVLSIQDYVGLVTANPDPFRPTHVEKVGYG